MEGAQEESMKCAPILVVEDDDDIRNLCRELLESEGYTVETCSNGREALDALEHHREPCLILLDMLMPVMNGVEFMKQFIKRPHTIVPIPIYLVSATGGGQLVEDIGCYGFLKKPFDIDALMSIVRAHCKVDQGLRTG
jgi:CheY-like chemotaxis protein